MEGGGEGKREVEHKTELNGKERKMEAKRDDGRNGGREDSWDRIHIPVGEILLKCVKLSGYFLEN